MKKQLKYRVWDGNMILYPDYVDLRDTTFYDDWRALEDGREMMAEVSMENLGINERNGIELYEGDIIRDNVGRLWIPKRCDKTLSFLFEYLKDRKQKQAYSRFNKDQLPFEWLGNEFEHSHLITGAFESGKE